MDAIKKRPKTENENDWSEEGPAGPNAKFPRQNDNQYQILFNGIYIEENFTRSLKKSWIAPDSVHYNDVETGAKVFTNPFQLCLLPELLHTRSSCAELVNEMIAKVHWSRKQMDLYEFYQSTDLSNMTECKFLTSFLNMMRQHVRPWMEKVTNLKLDYVSASCSMYNCGDYLLVHDDLLKDRQIAFIYYLSPWKDASEWTEDQGGCLEIFSSNEQRFPYFPVQNKISPRNNQFAFFKVGLRSFHQVSEVTTFDYPRLTINGWFHGSSNDNIIAEVQHPLIEVLFKSPNNYAYELDSFLNNIYLKKDTCTNIQKRIETNSEICLYDFLQCEIFTAILQQFQKDDMLEWIRKGPANVQNYEILDLRSTKGPISKLVSMFSNKNMFALLHNFTDLDLAGHNVMHPGYMLEIQRWSHGNYTVLGDGISCDESTLDLIYYINASNGAGIFTYLSPESEHQLDLMQRGVLTESDSDDTPFDDTNRDDSITLTVAPVDNALNMVYRSKGTTKFVKYISRNTFLQNGPVYVILVTYKE